MSTIPLSRKPLEAILDYWDTRLRMQQSLIWLPRGMAGGLVVALLIAIAARLWPLIPTQTVLILSGALALIGGVVTTIAVWVWPRQSIMLARRFDLMFGLKERMSTALELALGVLPVESDRIVSQQYHETLAFAEDIDPKNYILLHTDWREWVAALIVFGVLVIALFIPNPQDAVLAQQAEIEQAITEELEALEEIEREVREAPDLTADEQAAILEKLDEAIENLEQSDISQAEALATMDALEQDLRDLSEQFAAQRQQALQDSSGLFNDTAAQDAAEALDQGDIPGAAEALGNLDLDNLSPEEAQQLAEALQQMADELSDSNPELSQALQDAAEAMQSGDLQAAEAALAEAAGEMAQSGGGSVQQMDEFANQVGEGQEGLAGAGQGEGEGQGEADQPGQSGMGQAQPMQPGQGQGQGAGPHGAGRGEDQGEEQGGAIGEGFEMPTDNDAGDGGIRPFDDIYSPQRVGGEGGEEVDIPGDPGAGMPTGAEGDFADNPEGESTVPYNEVYADYEGAVNEALESGYVPLGLRDLIRDYFSSLDPE